MAALAVLLRTDVHDLDLHGPARSLDRGALSARPAHFLEVSLVKGRIVRVPLLSQALGVEATGVPSRTVDLVRTAIGRGHASESRMGTQDERQRENEELGHHCGGVDE